MVVCAKADLIDDSVDSAGAGASGMGGMVKGKGGEWEERTDGVMQVLRTICLKCSCAPTAVIRGTIDTSVLQMALHYSIQLYSPQRSRWFVNMHSTSSSRRLRPRQASPRKQPGRPGIHSYLGTSRTRSTAITSSYLRDGIVGARSRSCGTASTRRHGARHGRRTSRPRRTSRMTVQER